MALGKKSVENHENIECGISFFKTLGTFITPTKLNFCRVFQLVKLSCVSAGQCLAQ